MIRRACHRFVPLVACIALVASALVALSGCERPAEKADEPAAPSPDPTTASTETPGEAPSADDSAHESARTALAIWRPLLDEASRAELDAGGLFIDLGSVDGHKYTRGGWHNAWGHNEATEAETYAPMLETEASLQRPDWLDAPVRRVVARVRSRCAGQTLAVSLDGQAIGEPVPVGEAWQTVALTVPEAQARANPIALTAPATCSSGALHVDWLWLATATDGDPPVAGPRHAPLALNGKSRRALVATSPRALAFYLEPPPGAELVIDHGATADAELVVTAERDGAPARELWRASTTAADGWREARLDLSDFANHPTRLTLTVESLAEGGQAGFGEPDVMVPRAQTRGGGGFGADPRGAIVIAVDGLRATDAGPTLERLASEGVRFDAAHASGTWARPAAASLLSSLYPSAHGAHGPAARLSDDIELLPERLQQDGVASAGFVTGAALATEFGFDQGWRDYEVSGESATATALYDRALAWLDEHGDASFFVYLEPAEPQRAQATGADVAAAVAAHDEALGRFVDGLAERGLLDETLLVVTGSHGIIEADADPLSPAVLHVPLVARLPDVLPTGLALEEPVEGVDVAPTVLELLGLPPSELHQGLSLVPLIEGDPVQRPLVALGMDGDRAAVIHVGTVRLVVGPDTPATSLAPIARRLAEVHLGEALANETKRRRLDDVRHDLRFDSVEVDMDPALKKQLEALGYFGD